MKRITFLLSSAVLLSAFALVSCKEDNYLDWKYMNQQWLESHQNDSEWITTESGLQYRIIYGGYEDDARTPSSKSEVYVSYTGTYINGVRFDSAENGRLNVSSTVPGFQEGLKMMRRYAVYEFRIPYELGYGKKGSGAIPPYTTLLFRVTMNNFRTVQQ